MTIKYTVEDTPCFPNRYKVVPVGNYRCDNGTCNYFPTYQLASAECARREQWSAKMQQPTPQDQNAEQRTTAKAPQQPLPECCSQYEEAFMSVANLIKYAKCGNGDDVMDFDCNSDDQQYVKFEEAMEASSNSLQKIKSEIAADMQTTLDAGTRLSFSDVMKNVAKWQRQLSAN